MTARVALLSCALLSCALLAAACSRDDEGVKIQIDSRFSRQLPPLARGTATVPDAAPNDDSRPWLGDADAGQALPGQAAAVRMVTVDAAARRVNPDDAILERARVSAGGCFASLPAGPGYPPQRSAHIDFTVISTGTVSTANVSSGDTTDGRVLDCLHQKALSTVFSDNGGGPLRTYAIDVNVSAPGNAGGR